MSENQENCKDSDDSWILKRKECKILLNTKLMMVLSQLYQTI